MAAKRVGIPRGLFYYKYYPLWKTFFDELDVETVVSCKTNKKVLDNGVKSCVDEACLPVKVYYGHVIELINKVDYLFIPRFTSISKDEYVCPKFGGLPDMIRHTIKGLPEIIDVEVNLRKSSKHVLDSALQVGRLFCNDDKKIKCAFKMAQSSYREYCNRILDGIMPTDILDHKLSVIKKNDENTLSIAIVGHIYNICDSYVNMDMINKLKNYKANLTILEMIDCGIVDEEASRLGKKMFWYFGHKALGGVSHLLKRKGIDGIIYLMSFGCGIDSFICDLAERKVRRVGDLPFIIITIDEHSGQAGIDTRIEAFIDMIRWRKRHGNNISTYGQHIRYSKSSS
jgi:predicted nucleotide-binding protein (sugar kinase/HSP70/actin superfamily)